MPPEPTSNRSEGASGYDLVADEFALGPPLGAVVPAGSDVAGDGEAVEGDAAGELGPEEVLGEALAIRVSPATYDQIRQQPLGIHGHGDLLQLVTEGHGGD